MAYYPYDTYDPRSSTRRHDSFTRSQDNDRYLTVEPTAGHHRSSTSHERVGETNYIGQSHQQAPRHYDPRYRFPPPPPPITGRPPRSRRSPSRSRPSWPPQPICEDEKVSLAREADSQRLLKEAADDGVLSRGTIDQDQVIEEVPEFINQHERRFVVVSGSEKVTEAKGPLTPPTSEDERARKVKRRPSKLNIDLEQNVPEVGKRTASPYAFTKPTKLQPAVSSSERFLSPDTLTPPATDSGRRRNYAFDSKSMPSSPRRDSVRVSPSLRRSNDYFGGSTPRDDHAIDDDGWDTGDSATMRNRRKSVRSATNTDIPVSSIRTSVHDFASPPVNAPPNRKVNVDARRNTDTATTVPSLPKLHSEKTRRPTPLMASTALSDASDHPVSATSMPRTGDASSARPRDGSHASSRAASPTSTPSRGSHTPPRSPRSSADFSSTQLPAEKSPTYRPGSSSASGSGSRPSSPVPRTPGESPRLPRTDTDWNTLLEANASRRSKRPSRLASFMRQESLPDVNRTPISAGPAPRPAEGLPYPEDDVPGSAGVYMPSESDHQFFPQTRSNGRVPAAFGAKTLSRGASPAPGPAPFRYERPPRPSVPTRHSVANVSSVEEQPRPTAPRQESYSTSSHTRKEFAALLKKRYPECPRDKPVAGHDDWYTVIGAPSLDFCPDCVSAVFERTVFRPSIRRSPPRDLSAKVRCAFGSSPWIRLAWLLTLRQQRTDLTLLKDLANIEESSEPCPGSREAVRSWYGLQDPDGLFVHDFHLCFSDVRKVEYLLPTLHGFFKRRPHGASSQKHTCAIRADGNRFAAYLDALIATHERAMATRRGADPTAFIDFVDHKTRLRECTRDNLLIGALWHYIPNIPTLTVCEDCFESVVEPEIHKGSDLAMRFNQTVQPAYGEGMGSSCQLYSKRMRRVFKHAVEDNDLKYLARKSKERREAEIHLQERVKDVMRRARRLSRDGSGPEEDERRLNRELERITAEWQENWE